MSRPFLFLSVRPETDAVETEYQCVRRAMGVAAGRLAHLRLEAEPLRSVTLDDYAGVVVGGSPFNVTAPDERKDARQRRVEDDLTRLGEWAISGDRHVLFTCYGIGVLARAIGGIVDHDHGEDVDAVEVTLSEAGEADPLTGVLPRTFWALVGHKEAVSTLPAEATLLGGSAGCPIQVFRVGAHVYATQFHPEVTAAEFAARARVYRHHGYFPESEMRIVEQRLARRTVTEPQRLLSRFVELATTPVHE
jgi:GMP synthase (glutamine-hydrolysing)